MIRVAICEDEKQQQDLIEGYLKELFKVKNEEYEIIKFNSGEELLNDYPENIDIFLLDIQMDKINGMDVARSIRERDKQSVEIIFTTSLIDYMQDGYEVKAYRYLLKPIKYDDLKRHMVSCIKEISERNKDLVINVKDCVVKLKTSDITYVEVQRSNITIHTISNDYEIKSTMSKIESDINSRNFYRCHKSFLVNLEYVESIKQYMAILDNKEEVPISRHRFKDTKKRFFDLLEDKLC